MAHIARAESLLRLGNQLRAGVHAPQLSTATGRSACYDNSPPATAQPQSCEPLRHDLDPIFIRPNAFATDLILLYKHRCRYQLRRHGRRS